MNGIDDFRVDHFQTSETLLQPAPEFAAVGRAEGRRDEICRLETPAQVIVPGLVPAESGVPIGEQPALDAVVDAV
jgi:hypothetical protein